MVDTAQSGVLSVKVTYNDTDAGDPVADPWGFTNAVLTTLTPTSSVEGQVNVTTSKKMIMSTGRGFTTDTGDSKTKVGIIFY